ncbi:MAG: hypothetical protein VKL59_08210 [Nostocaceae cyanobacterium]|nr:hypothetical protein [Nostocaceae cyanobacterium]
MGHGEWGIGHWALGIGVPLPLSLLPPALFSTTTTKALKLN